MRPPKCMLFVEPKTLYNYYQVAVVKICLHFNSVKQYNINPSTHLLIRLSKTLPYQKSTHLRLKSSSTILVELPRLTNSQAATHISWLVRCSPHASRFSRSNPQPIHEFQTVLNLFIFSNLRKILGESFHLSGHAR